MIALMKQPIKKREVQSIAIMNISILAYFWCNAHTMPDELNPGQKFFFYTKKKDTQFSKSSVFGGELFQLRLD